ncbi:MAG: methyltransferase domain-containing protein [Rhodomicrobium sp.]
MGKEMYFLSKEARNRNTPEPLPLTLVSVRHLSEDVLYRPGIRIKPGMRVLDLGCGAGEGPHLIAKLVGPGLVVGVDESAEAINAARQRAMMAGQGSWTRFVTADLNTFIPDEQYDVVVVRNVQLLQSARVTLLRLSAWVYPDGIIIWPASRPEVSIQSVIVMSEPAGSWSEDRRGPSGLRIGGRYSPQIVTCKQLRKEQISEACTSAFRHDRKTRVS